MRVTWLCLLVVWQVASPARAQLQADTLFTWQGYARTATCHLRIYAAPPGADRSRVVVLRELAENAGPSTIADARHLAELVGRRYHIDPVDALWVYHWGAFSFSGAAPDRRKELFLRATFRRTSSQNLGTPSWKIVTREDVEAYTDRHFR